jgi:transaldolase
MVDLVWRRGAKRWWCHAIPITISAEKQKPSRNRNGNGLADGLRSGCRKRLRSVRRGLPAAPETLEIEREGFTAMPRLSELKVKLFTDGADKAQILDMAKQPWIAGFTTNPSLLRKAGVSDYEAYGRDLVAAVPDRHISFEVFSDDIPEMVAQAHVIAAWGGNVHVKLPVTNTRGEALFDAVRALSRQGVKINMTAIFTAEQAASAVDALAGGAPACVSVFAGRLADLGIDYRPIMRDAIACARATPNVEIIWASTREVFNVVEADEMGCHIITAPADVLKKLPALGTKTAAELSLAAVRAFREDALAAGLTLKTAADTPVARHGDVGMRGQHAAAPARKVAP